MSPATRVDRTGGTVADWMEPAEGRFEGAEVSHWTVDFAEIRETSTVLDIADISSLRVAEA